jgi:steroid 5-alpha reductase family enzyme
MGDVQTSKKMGKGGRLMSEDDRIKTLRKQTQKTANDNGKNFLIVLGVAILGIFLLLLVIFL